jgi:hypothetical protein
MLGGHMDDVEVDFEVDDREGKDIFLMDEDFISMQNLRREVDLDVVGSNLDGGYKGQ